MSVIDLKSARSWQTVLIKIVRPIARFALRHGVKIQEIQHALNQVLIEEASEELKSLGNGQNVSRISVMTGIHRREVSRQFERADIKHNATLIAKVVGQWQHSRQYQDQDGHTRKLTVGFESSEFNQLVRSVSKELNPASVLFDLERTGVISITDGKGTLERGAYSPPENFDSGIEILAADIDDMILAVEDNLTKQPVQKNLHARTVFDALRTDALKHLKEWVHVEGLEFHRRIRAKFSEYDQDINPEVGYSGEKARVVVGSFSRFE